MRYSQILPLRLKMLMIIN